MEEVLKITAFKHGLTDVGIIEISPKTDGVCLQVLPCSGIVFGIPPFGYYFATRISGKCFTASLLDNRFDIVC